MVRVKVCGLTNLQDALAAVEAGAHALGFVFAPSPRRMTPEPVREIVQHLPPLVSTVGVFVDQPLAEVQEILAFCCLNLAQLHGEENPDYCAALGRKAVKVFTPRSLPPMERLSRYPVAAYMLDREKETPQTPPEEVWPLARELGRYGPVILAGGLSARNVARAIEVARPYAVDVASGVESHPGKKDPQKLRAFMQAAWEGERLVSTR